MAKINGCTAEYYVGIMCEDEMHFVYETDNAKRMSYWAPLAKLRKDKIKPQKMTRLRAQDLMWALRVNSHRAYVLTTLEGATL